MEELFKYQCKNCKRKCAEGKEEFFCNFWGNVWKDELFPCRFLVQL